MAKKPQKTKKTPPTVSDQPLLEKKARNDSPTGEGNTIGEIVGQPPQTTKAPGEASPVLTSGTQTEKKVFPLAPMTARRMQLLKAVKVLPKWGKVRPKIPGILG